MAGVAIPLTSTTNAYTDALAAVFDFGGTPYVAGYFYAQNAGVYYSAKVGPAQGDSDWSPDFPTGPTLVPIYAGQGTNLRPAGQQIYGLRFRSLAAGTPAVVYGGLFQAGDAFAIPGAQLTGTITPGGTVTPGMGTINGITGSLDPTGVILAGTGFTVNHSGTGVYAITFTPPLSAAPVIAFGPAQPPGSEPWFFWALKSANGFTAHLYSAGTTNPADCAFDFIAIVPQ